METNASVSLRANPTAFAKSDCHTCTTRRVTCDRSRPRCGNCEESGIKCGGFVMRLSWQQGFSTSRKPVKRSITRRNAKRAAGEQTIEFISENPAKKPRCGDVPYFRTPSSSSTASAELDGSDEQLVEISSLSGASDISSLVATRNAPESLGTSHGRIDAPKALAESEYRSRLPDLEGVSPESRLQVRNPIHYFHGNENSDTDSRDTMTIWEVSNLSFPLTTGITYSNLFERYEPLFERYNKEFCILPLTSSDMHLNPFRYSSNKQQESLFLAHAVMALTCHHLGARSWNQLQHSEKVSHHHQTALHLFRQNLKSRNIARIGQVLLDTILILFSLDEAQSSLGIWTVHLKGAFGIIEACGGIQQWAKSPRAMVQIGLLVWWDAVTALFSREGCVLPYSYFEAILALYDDQQWSFFALCGCPRSLVEPLIQLAHLSAEKHKTLAMLSVVFDTTLVSEIEKMLENWVHMSPETAVQDEESMHQDQDTMHCSEAWRHGLILYIYRIFWWEPGREVPVQVAFRARSILDHIFACRDDVNVPKQALLPLFLAGCELRNSSLQGKVVKFCSSWDQKSGYHIFNSAIPFLEEVWADQEALGFNNVWWGQIVDRKHFTQSNTSLEMRITFG